MSRQEKIGAIVLGVLLFLGLFHFIYTTMKTPFPPEYEEGEYTGLPFGEEEEDFLPEEETPAEGETAEGTAAEAP